jgi:hypothetical protein
MKVHQIHAKSSCEYEADQESVTISIERNSERGGRIGEGTVVGLSRDRPMER